MASETITQNDLREILSRTVGSVPSEYKKLLWSNPNPTANFPTQALLNGEDLTVYDAIEVIGINYSGYKSIMPPLQIPIGGKGNLIGLAGSTGDSAGMGFLVMRGISVNTNSIVVSGAMGVSTNGASWSANDNNMIPYKIYGIKYERVAPPQVEYNNYSTEEQEVGTFIDGKTIYRKSKIYTYAGSTNYDSTFFNGITPYQIINQRVQIMSNSAYAKTMDYWSSSDFCRCWIYLTSPYMVCFNLGGASNGAQVLITVDYTKA